jgi:hypothetical protein
MSRQRGVEVYTRNEGSVALQLAVYAAWGHGRPLQASTRVDSDIEMTYIYVPGGSLQAASMLPF